jgi:DNA-binding transcriptional LysR family regulator
MKTSYAKLQSSLSLNDLELLLALIRGGTLQGAAERLKVDSSTIFRSIKRLEKNLGEVLFDRSKQGYIPSDLAMELAAYAERIESQLQEAREVAHKMGSEPSGMLRITTTDTVLHSLLLPLMGKFAESYPKIQLELIASNALANLSRRDADVAIRATRTPSEHLVGVKLGTLRAAVFASKEYLLRQGEERQLDAMEWIALDETLPDHPSQKWRWHRFPKLQPRYRVNSVMSVAGSVVCGLGVGIVPLIVFKENPHVQIVEGPLQELDTDLWALAHPDARNLQRVKVLFEFLRQHIKLP